MKNNFRFIFPRLIGATVVVGLAALIITTLFKLLIGLVVIGGVVSLAGRLAGRNRMMHGNGQYGQIQNGRFGQMNGDQHWANNMTVSASPLQRSATIVPID